MKRNSQNDIPHIDVIFALVLIYRFVNVELCGTKPQCGAKGTQATVLLENPKGDYRLSMHGLLHQVIGSLIPLPNEVANHESREEQH